MSGDDERHDEWSDTPAARAVAVLVARINKLEIALTTIVGHGNITVERAKQVAREALEKGIIYLTPETG